MGRTKADSLVGGAVMNPVTHEKTQLEPNKINGITINSKRKTTMRKMEK